jgi:calcineurin-like phosphoesterase
MGRHLDGKVSAVLGTHTHVPTADECILPEGTAFQCDVGMTGPYHSILGRRIDRVSQTTRTFVPTAFDVARDDVRLGGTLVDIDPETARATAIRRICVTEEDARVLSQSSPAPAT